MNLLSSRQLWFCLLLLPLVATTARADEQAERWLAGLGEAYRTENYEGRFVFMAGDKMHTMEVLHGLHDGLEYERLRHLNGSGAQIIRRGEQIICQLPEGEARLTRSVREFVPPFANIEVGQHYQVESGDKALVAGRAAIEVSIIPRDSDRLMHKLWIDQETGLLLRSQTLTQDPSKEQDVLESFEFVSLDILPDVDPALFEPDPDLPEQQLFSKPMEEKSMAMSMFTASWLPDGFVLGEIKHWQADNGRGETQMFSDGVSAFTIFVEPISDDTPAAGSARSGATVAADHLLIDGDARFLVTVVGELPLPTAQKIAQHLALK